MKTFEIHITGDDGINKELDSLNIKNIVIGLLDPNDSILRIEYMSSFISQHETYEDCKEMVDNLVFNLKSEIFRVKIESPVYPDYIERSIYIESHFPNLNLNRYPKSKNLKSGKILCTDRIYNKNKFKEFQLKWKDFEVELCLFDDFIREDKDWFDLYK